MSNTVDDRLLAIISLIMARLVEKDIFTLDEGNYCAMCGVKLR